MKVSAEINLAKPKRIVIIGTGPVSLLKACFLARNNPSDLITLIDSANQIGGAWYSDKSPKGHEIECGCHIWSYTPTVYRYITKELGITLFPMKPNAVFIGRWLRIPYSIKNTIDSYKTLLKIIFGFRWSQFKKIKSRPDINFRIIGKKNKYPKTGSPELIHAIEKKINDFPNIKILLNTNVESISIDKNIQLKINNEILDFDKIYVTYVSQFKSLEILGKKENIKVRHVDYIHFLIGFNKPLKKKISYLRFMNDPIVHRITDISYQTNFEENLILVGIKGVAYSSNSEQGLMKYISDLLSRNRLTDLSFEIQKIKTHIFPTYYIEKESLEKLSKYPDKFSLMHTTDLMYGMYFLLQGESDNASI